MTKPKENPKPRGFQPGAKPKRIHARTPETEPVKIKDAGGLTPAEEHFARQVAAGVRYYAAYLLAYPSSNAWTKETVYVAASKAMTKPKIRARVDELREEARKLAVLDVAAMQREIDLVAMVDFGDLFDDQGRLLAPHQMPSHVRKAIKKFEIDDTGTIKVELHSKLQALDMGAKIKGLYKADNEQRKDGLSTLIDMLKGNVISPGSKPNADGFGDELTD